MSQNPYDPEVEEVDIKPYEGNPDYDRPQAGPDGKQDD